MDPPARNSLVAFFDAVGRAIDGPVTWFRGDKMFIFNPNDCLMIEFHICFHSYRKCGGAEPKRSRLLPPENATCSDD